MRRGWMILSGFLLLAGQLLAQNSGFKPVADVTAFRQQFAKAAQQTRTIQADFVQEKNLSMLSDKITSKGKFWFKKEDKVRMEYQQPSYYLLVINGKDIRTKDGHKEHKVSAKSNKLFEQINKITIDCVKGSVLDNKDFTSRILENNQQYQLEMVPVAAALKQYFKAIQLLVDKKDFSVSGIRMLEVSGDDTNITFLHKQLNTDIPDAIFAVK
ncbi:outer membrane lipoprotein carrier protein LolA [Chitinophaga pendula]|uniref:outer membrane lipoprotein carrier protein LolA n=1 Tax=Chitinophaga TaxID=79328 RepID=UPI000BB0809A|nr:MULTISPECIES: outer membrane lipoprotein carrier protein LolA [Chitinophaga]ASZ11468.1 cell envelope biogenesis protein LolA [Chitinophaga sp. MD30]UCJ05521.1 outer membrane lipoprotein carrier protein LolA [Chitinophaga pendula]